MITIGLKSLKFYGYHGVFEEERINGGSFEFNASIEIPEVLGEKTDQVEDTFDYTRIVAIIKEVNQTPRNLLEKVVNEIIERIQLEFQSVIKIEVSMEKLQPPISEDIHSVFVKKTWKKAVE